ncbi:hypothetical protein [Nonomuraea sp. NPDC046570]|uniref:hypothetical protein n=1 Tax=Nonomuraea sp. NPDC046570 TaxID=3155255 RepID=UPI0033F3C92C
MTSRTRALYGGALWGLLVIAALVAVPLLLRDRLPDLLATHWSGDLPDGHMTFTGSLVSALGMWAVAWLILLGVALQGQAFERRLSRTYWWGFLGGFGVFALGMELTTVQANLDAASWTDARLSGWSVLAVFAAAIAAGVAAGFLGRGAADQRPVEGEEPPRLRLRAGQRSVWVSRLSNPWLLALAVVPFVALLGFGALSLTGLVEYGVAGFVLPVLLLAVLAGLTTSSLTARITEHGLAIGFGPFGWPVRRIGLSKIEKAWAEDRFPSQVGGWGLRGLPGSAAIMLRGGECLVIRYRSGGQLVVSVDDAGRGASLLNALIQERAA